MVVSHPRKPGAYPAGIIEAGSAVGWYQKDGERAGFPPGRSAALFPRGRLWDGPGGDHIQEILALAVDGRRGLVHG